MRSFFVPSLTFLSRKGGADLPAISFAISDTTSWIKEVLYQRHRRIELQASVANHPGVYGPHYQMTVIPPQFHNDGKRTLRVPRSHFFHISTVATPLSGQNLWRLHFVQQLQFSLQSAVITFLSHSRSQFVTSFCSTVALFCENDRCNARKKCLTA